MASKTDIMRALRSCSKLKVLYVEDNDSVRESSLVIFNDFFSKVDYAKDGLEGLSLFKKDPDGYDLVISDITMPNMNGIEMTREIKAIRDNISIIIISARDESEKYIDLIELRVDGFILKPLELDQFVHTLTIASENISRKKEVQHELDVLVEYKEVADEIVQREIDSIC